jgi:hypothetical protein
MEIGMSVVDNGMLHARDHGNKKVYMCINELNY